MCTGQYLFGQGMKELTPDGQYRYMVMGQGLKTAVNMYSRFRDITFGSILGGYTKTGECLQGFKSIIGDHVTVAFDGLIHDSYLGAESLEAMFDFLESSFLPRCAFGPHYLKPSKSFFFYPTLEFVRLMVGRDGIWPSLQKTDMILSWLTLETREEMEAFCYLMPYVRWFILGRTELVKIMKGEKEEL
jgi:hypothetical protein